MLDWDGALLSLLLTPLPRLGGGGGGGIPDGVKEFRLALLVDDILVTEAGAWLGVSFVWVIVDCP